MALDYAFLRNQTAGESCTIVVMKDVDSKAIIAHTVPCKGAEVEWTSQQLCRDIRRLGYHGRVQLRSDQEPAIITA